jgi:hypothetical protein
MNSKIFILTSFLVIGLFFNSVETNAQFQTFPTPKTSISGEKVKTVTNRRGRETRNATLKTTGKRERLKTGKKFIRSQSCSNFSIFYSSKAARRQKALSRQRKKLS